MAAYLGDLQLEGPQAVLGGWAMRLAEAAESCPAYALPKFGEEIRAVLDELGAEERQKASNDRWGAMRAERAARAEDKQRRQDEYLASIGVESVSPEEVRQSATSRDWGDE